MKTGDTVRYLNATGGGIVRRIEGQIAYVEEDGFETPVLVKELVVVLPAGHQGQAGGARLMFDQAAFDAGKSNARGKAEPKPQPTAQPSKAEETLPPAKVEETPHGDIINLTLAFEPSDVKRLSESRFNAVLVNDSNYFLSFTFCTRADGSKGWTLAAQGSVAPNELIDLAEYTPAGLPEIERIAIQAVAYKEGKEFELQNPVAISRRIDITKFHKYHCFRPGRYFDTPVLEFSLISQGKPTDTGRISGEQLKALEESLDSRSFKESARNKNDRKQQKQKPQPPSPFKLLDPIEIDLHIDALTDSIAGMQPSDMLELQLRTVRDTMAAHHRRIGQKIIFIHGKGEGVLRQAVIKLLKKEYPKAELQDASFREYGFGATLVIIH